jgi:hypothetical protein
MPSQPVKGPPIKKPLSFAAGGMMSDKGTAIRPGMAMQDEPLMGADQPAPMNPAQLNQEAQKFAQSNPQVMQQTQAIITQAIQSGELTGEELNMAVQLSKAALANPASYPQVRQFAIQNGLGSEQDVPQEMDQGLLFTLLVVGQAMQANKPSTGGAAVQPSKEQPAGLLPEYREGGMTGDKPHIAQLHANEYVATKEALLYHGKKTYDKLEEQARTPKDGSQGN